MSENREMRAYFSIAVTAFATGSGAVFSGWMIP